MSPLRLIAALVFLPLSCAMSSKVETEYTCLLQMHRAKVFNVDRGMAIRAMVSAPAPAPAPPAEVGTNSSGKAANTSESETPASTPAPEAQANASAAPATAPEATANTSAAPALAPEAKANASEINTSAPEASAPTAAPAANSKTSAAAEANSSAPEANSNTSATAQANSSTPVSAPEANASMSAPSPALRAATTSVGETTTVAPKSAMANPVPKGFRQAKGIPNVSDMGSMNISDLPYNATHFNASSPIWPCEYPSMNCNKQPPSTIPPLPELPSYSLAPTRRCRAGSLFVVVGAILSLA